MQIFFTINEKSTIFVQFCSNFEDLTYPLKDQSLKVWAKSDKNCGFFVNSIFFWIFHFFMNRSLSGKFTPESNFQHFTKSRFTTVLNCQIPSAPDFHYFSNFKWNHAKFFFIFLSKLRKEGKSLFKDFSVHANGEMLKITFTFDLRKFTNVNSWKH